MAGYNKNRYQYETSPRKLQPEYEPTQKHYPKKSTAKKATKHIKAKRNSNSKIVLIIGFVFVVLFAISYRNALITQKYDELKGLKSELSDIEKENKQLEVNIEGKTNLGTIEEKASKDLGLKKLNDEQTVYVSLDKQDYIESSVEEIKVEENSNWFETIINNIKNIFLK